jgi:hypothetical protein
LKDRVMPNVPTAAPVRMAEASKPAVKAGFGLSGDLLKDIDRKAVKETKFAANQPKRNPIDAIMAKLDGELNAKPPKKRS